MKITVRGLFFLLLLAGGLWAGKEFLPQPGEAFVPDELVVRLKAGAALDQVNGGLPAPVAFLRRHPRLQAITVRVNPALRNSISAALAASPLVEYVEHHHVRGISALTPSDPSLGSQWALPKVQAADAWSLFPARFPQAGEFGARVRVAVLDTGADCTHPDFVNPNAAPGGNPTDSAYGGQFSFALSQAIVPTTTASPACPWHDDHGHGTHVSGTIAAATNNAAGVAGLAFTSELLIFKVLDRNGSGYDFDIADAITAAADSGARVISLSLGGSGYSQILQEAVDYAWSRNALVVAATGNSGSSSLFFPAGANFALGIGATDSADARASWSNYGFVLDVMAPGVGILSTANGGGYVSMSGTSMATPHASALAALIFAANPGITAEAVAQRILASSDLIGTGGTWNTYLGFGRINAWRALSSALPLRTVGGLVGQVVDSGGSPVGGALVNLAGISTTTGSNGLFRFVNFQAGPLAFSATAAGQPARVFDVVIPPGADAVVRVEMLANIGTFGGFVRSSLGDPIPGANVQALQGGLIRSSGESASDGLYSLQTPAGAYDLRVSAPGLATQTISSQSVGAGGFTAVDFSIAALGRIAGAVRDQASNPVAGAQILISDGSVSAGAVSDAAGLYTSLGLPAGVYTVSAAKTGFSHTPVSGVVVANNLLVSLDLTLSSGVAVTSLTLSPSTVGGGAVATGTVNISPAAGPNGVVVSLASSNPGLAQTPANVTVASGASSANFNVTTATVAASTPVTITATLGGSSQSSVLTLIPYQVLSLTLSPSTVTGGASTTSNRVALNVPAPPGGALVALSGSDPAHATVPANVTVPGGATLSAYFTITTTPVSVSTPVVISASYAGSVAQATLTLTPNNSLYSFTVSPTVIAGGKTIPTASVRLTSPAPAGGAVVALQSSNPAAAPPPSVTVLAGAIVSANFTIPTSWVTQSTAVVLTASFSGSQKTVNVTVKPTALSSLSLAASGTGGKSLTGTVTLNGPASPSGAIVALSSSDPVLTVPASVTVPSGATSKTFTASAAVVSAPVQTVVTASFGGVSRTANVTVNPAVLSSVSLSSSVAGGKSLTGTAYLTGPALPGGQVVTLSSSNPAAATVPASITVAGGASSATFTLTSVPVAAPVAVVVTASSGGVTKTVNVTVRPAELSSLSISATVAGGKSMTGTAYLTGPALPGGQVVTLASSNPAAAVPASVTVAGGATSAAFTLTSVVVAAPVTAVITASSGGITKTKSVTVLPAVLYSFALATSVTGGKSVTGTANLTGPALPSGQVVTLSSSNPAATVPASITVAGGASSATFTLTSVPVAAPVAVVVTASSGGVTKTVTITVRPAELSSLSISATVAGGKSLVGTVYITGPALPAGQVVTLSSSNPAATVPASVTVAGGATSATFTLTSFPVAATVAVVITASSGGVTKTVNITVTPPSLTALTLTPATVKGGLIVVGRVTLNTAAPAGGVTVTLSSANPAAAPPASVTVPAGATFANFNIATNPVAGNTSGAISATLSGVTKSANLTVTP